MPSLIKRISYNKFLVFVLISTAAVLTGVYFLNDIVLSVRMLELRGFLERINRESSGVDELGMLAKYKLHLDLYERRIDDGTFDKEELDAVYLATSYEVQSKKTMTNRYSLAYAPVVWIVNALRVPLRKPPIESIIDDPSDDELTLAYYFERNKKFRHALAIYEKAVSGKLIPDDRVPIVLLHQGYCRSLLGEYDEAKSIFVSIIKNYTDENIAITAALMLQYLERIRSEVNKVKASTDSTIEKSQKLYRLIAYEEAIEVLETIRPQNDKEAAQIAYLNARCLEETGKTEESVSVYQNIIERDSDSEAAKAANRRLIVLASTDDDGKAIKELAIRNNETIRDDQFDALLATSDKVDRNREQIDPEARKRRDAEIIEMKTEERATDAARATEVETSPEPSGEPSRPPTPEPTKTPAIERTPLPTTTPPPTPGTPYSKDFRDSKGNIYKTEMYDAYGRLETIKYRDEKGSVYKIEFYATNGKIKTINYTDARGNINKVEMYDVRGILLKTITYEFDKDGNPVSIKEYDRNGRLIEDR